MTPRDQKLLEKQLHGIDNRLPEGIFMLAFATVFFAGMAVGGFLFRLYRSAAVADGGKRRRRANLAARPADDALKFAATVQSCLIVLARW
jgi:hypothetical protein